VCAAQGARAAPRLRARAAGGRGGRARAGEKVRLMFFRRFRRANRSEDTSSLALLAKGVTQKAT